LRRGWVTSAFVAPFPELLLNSGAVRLGGAAPEIFYIKACHGTILAYIHRSSAMRTALI